MGYLQTLDGDFLRTPQYTSMVTYNKTFETIRELELDGNTEQNGYWIRPVETTYKGATGYVPIYLNVQGDEETGYSAIASGIITEPIMSDLAYDISFGLGARWDIYSDDYIEMVNKIGEEFANIPTVIVNDTRYVVDTLVEWINQYIIDKYGDTPVDKPYIAIQKTYAEGQGTLIEWNNKTLPETVGAMQYDNAIADYDYKTLFDELNRLKEEDEDIQRIFNYPNVRIGWRAPSFPTDTRICICGMTLANNDIVTTTESGNNQHYGVRVTHVDWVEYNTSSQYYPSTYPTLTKVNSGSSDVNTGETLYNYPRDTWLPNGSMMGTSAVVHFSRVIDSIGYVGKVKPYEVLPVGGLWTKQPNNTYKVGYPDPEEDEDQDPVRNGDPVPINIIFRPHYIIGVPPVPEPDPYRPVPWDREDPTPDVDTDSFYTVFEVNKTMLNSLNEVLWNTSALEEIKRAFTNNPLEAIISLHQVYYIPNKQETESGIDTRDIHLGAYNTHIKAPIIPKRYQRIEYNPIPVNKQFESIRDYQRDLTLYLPFIGFRQLDITDVCGNTANSSIYISYTVDNLTGDCVAIVSVNKDGNIDRKPLYMFNGNCSSQLPLTGADRSGLLSASLSAIGGVASTVLTGGATAPSLIGSALNFANNMGMSIDRSGNITGNHGAMLYKYPFLIINYPIPFDAENFKHYGGGSSNVTTTLKYCQGFTKMSECIIDSIPCTSQEKSSIQSMLASGIII